MKLYLSRDLTSRIFLCGVVSVSVMTGCVDERVQAPEFDPPAIASGAITAYDQDDDGLLGKAEVDVQGVNLVSRIFRFVCN